MLDIPSSWRDTWDVYHEKKAYTLKLKSDIAIAQSELAVAESKLAVAQLLLNKSNSAFYHLGSAANPIVVNDV